MQFCVLLLLLLLLLLFNINSLFLSVILINNHFFSFLRHNVTELKATQSNLFTMVTLRKWQGDRYMQGGRYTKGNFAQKIRDN